MKRLKLAGLRKQEARLEARGCFFGGGGSAPPAPDPVKTANAQAAANTEAARVQAALDRVNQVTPYGNLTYSNIGDKYTATTTLSPEQQKLLETQNQVKQGLGGLATGQIGRVQDTLSQPFQPNLPDRVYSVGPMPDYLRASDVGPANLRTNLDFSGAPALPGINDFSKERDAVTNAMYARSAALLDPQYAQREQALESKLANQGIARGSEAYNTDYGNFARERESAYADARDRALLAGGAEQSRLFGQGLAARQQGIGEEQAGAQFQNTAAQQQFQNLMQQLGVTNATEQQQMLDMLNAANLSNTQRGQAFGEESYLRQLPINELLAAMGNSQVQTPQFGQTPGAQPIAAAPIQQALNQQYQGQLNQYNADVASRNANNQALGSAAGMAAMGLMMAGMF